MERYNIVQYYDFYVDTVCKILMDNDQPSYSLEDLPNVSQSIPLECVEKDGIKYIKNKWNVHGQMPPIVQKIIKPEHLNFIEESTWDRAKHLYSTKIIPGVLRDKINCAHKLEFIDEGDGRTKRVLTGHFELKIPIVGPVFEGIVVTLLKKNCDDDYRLSVKAIEDHVRKNGDPHAEKSKKKI